MKIGFSKDIHKLIRNKNKQLIIGNFVIQDSKYSIKSHSDGDIVLHAITSAILGSLNMKTIGEYFSDDDITNKDRSSVDFLKFALNSLKKHKLKIESVDICIICEKIMLSKHLDKIRNNLINLLNTNNIGIKATRFENKRNKFIECYCSLIIN